MDRRKLLIYASIPACFVAICSMLLSLNSPSVLWCATAVIALIDKILGAWYIFPPALSWAIVAFIVASLCHFAIFESHKVGQRENRISYLVLAVLIFALGPFVWAGIGILLAYS